MTVLDFRPVRRYSNESAPLFCDQGCQVPGGFGPKWAAFTVAGLGHPAGQVCVNCKRTLEREWEAAFNPEPEPIAA